MRLAREVICNGNLSPDSVQGGGTAISLGCFQNFVHRHELHREVSFKLEMEIDKLPEYYSDYDAETPDNEEYNAVLDAVNRVAVEVALSWGFLSEKPYVVRYTVELDGIVFTTLRFAAATKTAQFSGCNPEIFITENGRATILSAMNSLLDTYQNAYAEDNYPAGRDDCFTAVDAAVDNALPTLLHKFTDVETLYGRLFPAWDSGFFYEKGFDEVGTAPSSPSYCTFFHISWPDWRTPLDVDNIDWWLPETFADSGSSSAMGHRETAKALMSALILGPGALAAKVLSQMSYIGSSRITPERHFVAEAVQTSGWSNGMTAWKALTENYALLEKVNNELPLVMGEEFGLLLQHQKEGAFVPHRLAEGFEKLVADGEDIDPARIQTLLTASCTDIRNRLVFMDEQGTFMRPCDLGHGVSQIVPLITAPFALESAHTQRLLAIEEPESNIHPAWQVELAEFFLRIAAQGNDEPASAKPGVENAANANYSGIPPLFLLETHSEHIMLRLLRRIRETLEGDLPEGATAATIHDVAVHYIQKGKDGCTEVLRMEITPDGDFARQWPKGFLKSAPMSCFNITGICG